MDEEPKPNEEPQETQSNKERLEELRKWFESLGDCV
jgi:hypothetical protein